MAPKMESLEFIDITPVVSEKTAVFPGDLPFKRRISMDFIRGDHLALSSIETTVHIGAHTDAPSHYHAEGAGIADRDLSYYLGRCQVVTVRLKASERIRPEHLARVEIKAPRVLFKTNSYPDHNQWNGDFNSLSSELVEFLASKDVKLIGIDTPSIDLSDDKVLQSHKAVYKNNMAILEGIVLDQVPDGFYTLVALPLKIEGADASPVRAVLLKENALWRK